MAHVDVIRGQHDLLVLLDRAVHVEDQRVRIPRKKIVLGSAYQVRRREPAERRVVKIELDGGITLAELLLHGFGPGLRGDGLAVKKDPQFPQGLRGGLAELAHAALDERGARVFPGRCGQDRKQPQEEEGGGRGALGGDWKTEIGQWETQIRAKRVWRGCGSRLLKGVDTLAPAAPYFNECNSHPQEWRALVSGGAPCRGCSPLPRPFAQHPATYGW